MASWLCWKRKLRMQPKLKKVNEKDGSVAKHQWSMLSPKLVVPECWINKLKKDSILIDIFYLIMAGAGTKTESQNSLGIGQDDPTLNFWIFGSRTEKENENSTHFHDYICSLISTWTGGAGRKKLLFSQSPFSFKFLSENMNCFSAYGKGMYQGLRNLYCLFFLMLKKHILDASYESGISQAQIKL